MDRLCWMGNLLQQVGIIESTLNSEVHCSLLFSDGPITADAAKLLSKSSQMVQNRGDFA